MMHIIALSAVTNLAFTIAAVIVLIAALRVLDKMAGFDFREWLHNEKTSDLAKAVYFGSRIIAAALIVGMVVSIPV